MRKRGLFATEARANALALARPQEGAGEKEGGAGSSLPLSGGALSGHAGKVVEQIGRHLAGTPISDRLVSLFKPGHAAICKGKLRAPTEFGYVSSWPR